MEKTGFNLIVDILMLISFIATVLTIFGWKNAHEIFGSMFIVLAIVHFLINFKQMSCMIRNCVSTPKKR